MKTLVRLEECLRKKADRVSLQQRITATVHAHGGPCMNAADIERVIAAGKSRTQQMSILKDEIRYLTKVLGKKDDRLVMEKKSFDHLYGDFVSYLGLSPPVAVVPHPPPPATYYISPVTFLRDMGANLPLVRDTLVQEANFVGKSI